ncbi:MAG: hypothetical protein LW823_08100 [Rickettsiales bacterium]|jgi:hypothetical protein|nr:hypothetical protein [Rickettsiales bacterium]
MRFIVASAALALILFSNMDARAQATTQLTLYPQNEYRAGIPTGRLDLKIAFDHYGEGYTEEGEGYEIGSISADLLRPNPLGGYISSPYWPREIRFFYGSNPFEERDQYVADAVNHFCIAANTYRRRHYPNGLIAIRIDVSQVEELQHGFTNLQGVVYYCAQ